MVRKAQNLFDPVAQWLEQLPRVKRSEVRLLPGTRRRRKVICSRRGGECCFGLDPHVSFTYRRVQELRAHIDFETRTGPIVKLARIGYC